MSKLRFRLLALAVALGIGAPVLTAHAEDAPVLYRDIVAKRQAAMMEKFGVDDSAHTPDARIVGGFLAPSSMHKFQVGLYQRVGPNTFSFFCGGALYKGRYVITAAHCSDFVSASQVVVLAKSRTLFNADGLGAVRDVSRISIHKKWNPGTFDYDVAVWKLSSGVAGVKGPVLAKSSSTAGTSLTVTGWGATSEGGSGSDNLLGLKIPVIAQSVCNGPASYAGGITSRMFCAGFMAGGKDTCQGDSGGPVTKRRPDGRRVLSGIVSWGTGCARVNLPGVYTRVNQTSIRNFIVNKTP